MRDTTFYILILLIVIGALSALAYNMRDRSEPVPPEPQIIYIYMMEVPWAKSDFRGLLHNYPDLTEGM